MTKAESEKVVAVICQADSGCALCVAKQLALLCVIFGYELDWAVRTAVEAEPLGIAEEDLLEMVQDEHHALISQSPSNYLPV